MKTPSEYDRAKPSAKLIPPDVAGDLPRLQQSYSEKTGERFNHFFCPLMHRDDPVELCMGHIVPQSYPNCCRAKVAQRKDIDNFYGAVAEADFGNLLEAKGKTLAQVVFDKRLQRELRPQIVVEGEEVGYYPYRGGKDPQHTRVLVENSTDGRTMDWVIKKSPEEMLASTNKNWGVYIERDCRLTAMVTMIKAAYLTMFHLHGYTWALSHAGIEIGYSLLGRFFRDSHDKDVHEVRDAMKASFAPYKHMYRPIEHYGAGPTPRGTLEDWFSGVCVGSSGRPFAQIVYVRIDDHCHAVLMPAAEHPESAATFHEFLNNDNETLQVTPTVFNAEKQQWEFDTNTIRAHWPKKHFSFDFE